MIELDLCEALRKRISDVTASLLLQTDTPDNSLKSPDVINGFLPPKRSKDTPDFPFCCSQAGNGITPENESSSCTVKLLIGCFSEEFDGYEYCLQVLHEIRNSFMQQRTLDSRFRLEFPFDWVLYDDQPYPEWVLEATCRWSIFTPQELPDEGVL